MILAIAAPWRSIPTEPDFDIDGINGRIVALRVGIQNRGSADRARLQIFSKSPGRDGVGRLRTVERVDPFGLGFAKAEERLKK